MRLNIYGSDIVELDADMDLTQMGKNLTTKKKNRHRKGAESAMEVNEGESEGEIIPG